ncbi:MAG: leucine--tRNA ligase [Chloroflexi bacterium]|nr:MAG: leucine--tRNA ligase [Chloroflexota bacterium]
MSEQYIPENIEQKWQKRWEEDGLYRAKVDWSKPKHYALTMLPYPSGDLHIGHWFAMTPSDARARYMRMKGYNVLFPMGFDAFGLPAENAAIQRNIHPKTWTYSNIERMRGQLRSMGAMFDWEREAISCDPSYYHWTEWFFKKFWEGNLAYRGEALVNWSDALQTVLANEQVVDGKDERLGQPVIQKMMEQWFFRITQYADELLDFSKLDWPEPIQIMQTNWIGRSEGAEVIFHTEEGNHPINIYTTRPDTLWGATFMVLAPEHPLVKEITTEEQREAVEAYVEQAARATEIERTAENREKTGVFTGAYAINPVNNERIPIWIADYVMITYGSGAIMAVPAHDQRDFEFARKFGLPIRVVIQPEGETLDPDTMPEAWTGEGVMVNSAHFDGTRATNDKGRKNPAINAVIEWLEQEGIGKESVNYRLRDWLISRQRYWGAPIPMIKRQDGTWEAVADEDLPVLLPDDVDFLPTGQSPLKLHEGFKKAVDSEGNPAERETDTMDTFMCSSWYQYRYLSPNYDKGPFDPEEAAYWLPVDVYTGGAEHATMHLLYTRFFTKAMRDLGMFDETAEVMRQHGRDPEGIFDEPMLLLRNQGQVLGAERPGDQLYIVGQRQGARISAEYVYVMQGDETPNIDTNGKAVFIGELMRRTENILHVRNAANEEVIVEVPDSATVEIPTIDGENRVDQLKHHLEIQRMSKSKGNVVNPDELVEQYGADTVRAYLMFAFDWRKGGPWDPYGIKGPQGWIEDVWKVATAGPVGGDGSADRDVERELHRTIDAVSRGLETFSFNTAIAALMGFRSNILLPTTKRKTISDEMWREVMHVMLRLMAPFTPHITEELWEQLGFEYSVHTQSWPEFDPEKAKADTVELVVMVNGKPRDKVMVPAEVNKEDAEKAALESEAVKRALNGGQPKRIIFIPSKNGQEPKVNVVV